MSEAVRLYLRHIVRRKAIPSDVKIPNALTHKTLDESEEGIDLHTASSVDELFKEFEA